MAKKATSKPAELYFANMREEELKNKVAKEYFPDFDCTKIIGAVDFCVTLNIDKKQKELFEIQSLLWAEAKKGKRETFSSITQLILTIGKARTFDHNLPPSYLGSIDAEKIAFIPWNDIHDIFYVNDFNWSVAPSNHDTKEFKLVYDKVKTIIESNSLLFYFGVDDKDLMKFIKMNFIVGKSGTSKIKIDKNNFMNIYNKWLGVVKPTIAVKWELVKQSGLIDGDFYLADLLSQDNKSLKEKLYVLLKADHYELDRKLNESGLFSHSETGFKDQQVAHKKFWNRYERPPKKEYWDYIVDRRELLVPQDIRERKGSYYTPQIWVEQSQRYLSDVFGEDWQEEYFIWDCAAGTGNLLTGLTEKYNIYASTLDPQDVAVMHDRIKNGANLMEKQVFQFDFLNDDFKKLPKSLRDIIEDPKKRKKLVIYINPPYAEAASTATITGKKENKKDVAVQTEMYKKYQGKIGIAARELYVQFLTRIYCEIPGVILAQFSTLKTLQAPNFVEFRQVFQAKLEKLFVVPANTFDNVKGKFPIGFFIWDTSKKEPFETIEADVYNDKGEQIQAKTFFIDEKKQSINDWLISTRTKPQNMNIGFMSAKGNDFQNTGFVFIINDKSQLPHPRGTVISDGNLIEVCVYYCVRHCIEPTWLNDRDQFSYPNKKWEKDTEFQNDCFAYTLFHTNIKAEFGTNHWIPFTEKEVNAAEKFESSFMSKFIKGKIKFDSHGDLFSEHQQRTTPLEFSEEATEVFNSARDLWKYYHKQYGSNVNASLYDIREFFQGRSEEGKMNNKSEDETYNKLVGALREKLKVIEQKVQPKVYKYGFLKK